MIARLMVIVALLATFCAPVFAGTDDPGVNRRQHRQKDRIKQGVRSGELTKEEAKGLRGEKKAIREKEKAFKSDGQLTKDERKELHQELNESSKHIADEKHDAEKR